MDADGQFDDVAVWNEPRRKLRYPQGMFGTPGSEATEDQIRRPSEGSRLAGSRIRASAMRRRIIYASIHLLSEALEHGKSITSACGMSRSDSPGILRACLERWAPKRRRIKFAGSLKVQALRSCVDAHPQRGVVLTTHLCIYYQRRSCIMISLHLRINSRILICVNEPISIHG